MPKVGNREFPYTDKGRGQAEVYAAETGQTVSSEKDRYGYGTEQGGQAPMPPQPQEDYNSPKARLEHYLQPYVDEYLSAGEDEQKAYWLALIDVGVDPETKYHIAEDPEVKKMYEGLFQSNNINYLDVTHHKQTRKRLGLDSPHMDDAEEEQEQEDKGMQSGGAIKTDGE